MKKNVLILLTFMVISGCIVEDQTSTLAFLHNESGTNIEVLPYVNGGINGEYIISLNDGESIRIAAGHKRGIIKGPGFSSEYLSGVDSVAVVFADSFRVIHYESLLPTVFPDKYYLEEHPRNVLNIDNFEWSYEDKSKHSRIITHRFTFIEADYLDAKE